MNGATITLIAVAVTALTVSTINCTSLIRLNRTFRERNKELKKQTVLGIAIADLLISLPDNEQPHWPSRAHKVVAINKVRVAKAEIAQIAASE